MWDLQAAENTLNRFCERSQTPLNQYAFALTQLADWHMKITADVDSASAALQKIIERFPGTVAASQAEQRMVQLVETEKIILAQHDRRNIAIPEGVQNIGLLDSTDFLKPKEIDPELLAAAHVKHLEAHPHDSGERENLATIFARDFQRLDLATIELDRLINESSHQPKQVARAACPCGSHPPLFPRYFMKKLFILLSLAATLTASPVPLAPAVDFATVHASMTWTTVHSITNQVGDVRQARTAPASPEFWAAWRTNKPAMKLAGYSAQPTTNGWQAIQYVKGGNQ